MNTWLNKQIWRITKTYQVMQPMIAVVQLLLWGVIAIGINEWFNLTFEFFIIVIGFALLTLNFTGWVLDRRGFFLEHKTREFKIQSPDVYDHQVRLNAAVIARYLKTPVDELEDIIAESREWLGMASEEN